MCQHQRNKPFAWWTQCTTYARDTCVIKRPCKPLHKFQYLIVETTKMFMQSFNQFRTYFNFSLLAYFVHSFVSSNFILNVKQFSDLCFLLLSLVYLVCRRLLSSSSIKWENLLICKSKSKLQTNVIILPSEHYFTGLVEQRLRRYREMNAHIASSLASATQWNFTRCNALSVLE